MVCRKGSDEHSKHFAVNASVAGTDRRAVDAERRAIVIGHPAARFLDQQRTVYASQPDAERRAWDDLAQSLFALNAFLYLE